MNPYIITFEKFRHGAVGATGEFVKVAAFGFKASEAASAAHWPTLPEGVFITAPCDVQVPVTAADYDLVAAELRRRSGGEDIRSEERRRCYEACALRAKRWKDGSLNSGYSTPNPDARYYEALDCAAAIATLDPPFKVSSG